MGACPRFSLTSVPYAYHQLFAHCSFDGRPDEIAQFYRWRVQLVEFVTETRLPGARLVVAKFFWRATATDVDPTDCIRIKQLEVFARVGVTENERAKPQRLTLTITVWLSESFENLQDDITRTVNYSAICAVARDFLSEHTHKLIETAVAELAAHLLGTFPIRKVELELCKFVLPDARHVAVMVTREARRK